MPSSRTESPFDDAMRGSGACYSGCGASTSQILVSAPSLSNQPIYESLQGSRSWPSATPRRCHVVLADDSRVHRMSPVITLPLRAKATLPSLVVNRTRVRKHYATRSTCLAVFLYLAARYPTGREDAKPASARFSKSAWSTPNSRACERVLRFWMHKHTPGEG